MLADSAKDEYGRDASIAQLCEMAWTCYQELRVKRDAIALLHKRLRTKSDSMQKLIMALGLFTAAFESCRDNFARAFGWTDGVNAFVMLVPIATSTAIAALSAAQRYRRFAERLEMLAQARSDAQSVINALREFMQEHRVRQTPPVEARCEFRAITVQYNHALDNIETLTYPDDRRQAFARAYTMLRSRRNKRADAGVESDGSSDVDTDVSGHSNTEPEQEDPAEGAHSSADGKTSNDDGKTSNDDVLMA